MQKAGEAVLLRELTDQSGLIVAVVDSAGVLVACNEGVCRNAGREREELVGKKLSELRVSFPVHRPEHWQELLQRVEAAGELAIETELGHKDGSVYRARLTLSLQVYEGDTYLLVVGSPIPRDAPLQSDRERDVRWRGGLLAIATHETVAGGCLTEAADFITGSVRSLFPAHSCDIWERKSGWQRVGMRASDDSQGVIDLDRYPWLVREMEGGYTCGLPSKEREGAGQSAAELVNRHSGGALLLAPILIRGEVWGVLTLGMNRTWEWSADEVGFAAAVGGEIAHCVLNFERNQVQAELRASWERYRSFLEMSEELVWRVEFDRPIPLTLPPDDQVDQVVRTGFVADCNDALARFVGLSSAEQLRGARLSQVLGPVDKARRQELRTLAESAFRVTNLPASHTVAGKTRWVLRSAQGVIENGFLIRLWGTARDVTERKLAEDLLRASEQRYRAFIANSSEGIFRIEYPEPIPIHLPPEEIVKRTWAEGRIAECNQAMALMRGLNSPDQIVGRSNMDFRLATQEELQQEMDFVIGGFRVSGVERPASTAKGVRWFRYTALGVIEKDCLARVWGTVSDITERKILEDELRSLSARHTTILEQERARVAREIHDELGQQLTVLKFEASAWEQGKRKPMPGGITRELDNAIQTVRRIATGLRPVILDEYGLAAALEWQAKEFSRRTGIECACEIEDDIKVPDDVATTAFRILQEGLTNVARHAQAGKVTIHLSHTGDTLDLEVRDNGKGMPLAGNGVRAASLGMAGMRERARAVGGTVFVSSVPGQGTLVSASFPLSAVSTGKDTLQ